MRLTIGNLDGMRACEEGKDWFQKHYPDGTELTKEFFLHLGSYCLDTGNAKHKYLQGVNWLQWVGENLTDIIEEYPFRKEHELYYDYLAPWIKNPAHASNHPLELKASVEIYCTELVQLLKGRE